MRTVTATTIGLTLGLMASSAAASELVFWSMWNEPEPQAQALREVMAAYTAKKPDTTFKVVWNGRQNQVKIRAAIGAGTQIDFMDQDGDQLASGLVRAGLGLPLDEMLEGSVSEDMLPNVLDLFAKDGARYQLPYIYNPISIWYAKDLFKELGLSKPTTMKELLAACETAAAADFNLLVTEGNVANYQLYNFTYAMQRVAGNGAVRNVIADKTGEAWKSDAVRASLDAGTAMWDAKCFSDDVLGFQFPIGQQTIALGESVGELVGAWLPAELSKAVPEDFEWGSFGFPTIEGGTGANSDLQASLLTMMAFADSPNASEVLDFFKFLVSEEGQTIISTTGGVGVTNRNVKWNSNLTDGYELAINASAILASNDATNVVYPEFHTTVLAPTYSEFFRKQITAEEFMETMANRAAKFWSNQ